MTNNETTVYLNENLNLPWSQIYNFLQSVELSVITRANINGINSGKFPLGQCTNIYQDFFVSDGLLISSN